MPKPVVVPGIPSMVGSGEGNLCSARETVLWWGGGQCEVHACIVPRIKPSPAISLPSSRITLLGESVKKILRKHIKDHDKDTTLYI